MRSDKMEVSLCFCSVVGNMVRCFPLDDEMQALEYGEVIWTGAATRSEPQDDVWPLCPRPKGGPVRQTALEILPMWLATPGTLQALENDVG